MRRYQLFEFNDYPWLPGSIRGVSLGLVSAISGLFGVFGPGFAKVGRLAQATGMRDIQGLCGGDGRLMARLARQLQGRQVAIHVSDLHPDPVAYARLKRRFPSPNLQFVHTPVDAFAIGQGRPGIRLVVNAIHHFPPEKVKALLADAVASQTPIVFLEPLYRDWPSLLKYAASAPWLCLGISLGRALAGRLWYLLWGVLVPLGTFVHVFDGIVSHLRAYKPEELKKMVGELPGAQAYHWDIGHTQGMLGIKVVYLVGYAKPPA